MWTHVHGLLTADCCKRRRTNHLEFKIEFKFKLKIFNFDFLYRCTNVHALLTAVVRAQEEEEESLSNNPAEREGAMSACAAMDCAVSVLSLLRLSEI